MTDKITNEPGPSQKTQAEILTENRDHIDRKNAAKDPNAPKPSYSRHARHQK